MAAVSEYNILSKPFFNNLLLERQTSWFLKKVCLTESMRLLVLEKIRIDKNNNEWLKTHPAEAAIFSQPEITWENIKSPYKTTFSELVIGDLPKEKELIETLKLVYNRLRKVRWEVQFP